MQLDILKSNLKTDIKPSADDRVTDAKTVDWVIELKDIDKKYFIGHPNEIQALNHISLQIRRGEFISIIGASGSGKSTLMNIIGVLDRPTSGQYVLDGIKVEELPDHALSQIRNHKIGFIFQTFNLIARSSAIKNVELPMQYAGVKAGARHQKALELMNLVGMSDRAKHKPNELSGGQKQRVAIARAMANDPAILLADEPTGSLDSATGRMIMDLFHQLHIEQGKTIILITHSPELAIETDRIITLKDGLIIDERKGAGHP
jgi:putative ABC transport system ATP-binding protein